MCVPGFCLMLLCAICGSVLQLSAATTAFPMIETPLTAPDPGAWEDFGNSVATDGATVVVGHENDRGDAGEGNVGSAYVYEKVGGAWTLMQRLTASDGLTLLLLGLPSATIHVHCGCPD